MPRATPARTRRVAGRGRAGAASLGPATPGPGMRTDGSRGSVPPGRRARTDASLESAPRGPGARTDAELLERQRRQLIQAQAVGGFGSWEWDIAADTVDWSDELCRIFGVQPRLKRSFEDFFALVHPDDRAHVQATMRSSFASGEPCVTEHRIVRGGAVRVIHSRGEMIEDADGRPVRMLGTAQDVTHQRAAERSRGHLAALVDCSEDAIIAKSLDGVIERWNRGAQELFGYTAHEAVGQSISILVPPRRRDELARILAQIKRGERVEPLETVRVGKDGTEIDISLRISVIHDAEGRLVGASSISRSITRQKQLETQLRRSSRYFDLSRDLTVAWGFDGDFKRVNPALPHILGWSEEEFLERRFADLVHPDDRDATLRELGKLADGEVTLSFVNRYEAKDGGYRWLDWHAIVAPDEALMYATARDITERITMETALREAEQRFRTAFDGAPIGICLLSLGPDEPARLLQVNPALAEMLGGSLEGLRGAQLASLTHPDDRAGVEAGLATLLDGDRAEVVLERRLMHRDGHPVWALVSAARVATSAGEEMLAVTHVVDISDRKHSEGLLQHLADHDALTGLVNRRRFTEELELALVHARRFGETGAVLFLDLDGFKFVNDTLGHAAGDALIARVGGLLRHAVRETDTLARMGGDEFAVLLTRCDRTAAVTVAEKLLGTLRRDGLAGTERRGRLSSSIGIALFGAEDAVSADELVVEADIAMYEAKDEGKDRYAIYDHARRRRKARGVRESWTVRLERAIRDDGFVLHAQPIAAICGDASPAFELLLRLPDELGDLIAPGTFLHNAERLGLIEQIDRWVLKRAVRHLHDSHASGADLTLSVNVSGRSMGDPSLARHVAELLAAYPIPADRLILEITETAAITNIDRARALSLELRSLGCMLALDDFGAGFASFYYLKHLQFDYLKIDGEFIRNLCATRTDQLVVQAIVTIAGGLGTRTVAEFVGDDATITLLRAFGVDYGQGYHLGRPRPLDTVLPYLAATPLAT
jgi:diguanylate cyclase (GGDEF)-like protein/PAS domain S-box-containing protein